MLTVRSIAVLVSLALSLLTAELAARSMGHGPAVVDTVVQPWAAFDSEIGWTNRPNTRVQWPFGSAGATFWSDTSRQTRLHESTPAHDVVLMLGCSYTQGYGVADDDTFSWKLQQRFAQFDFRNFGTGGYGTYQSLLRFRRYLREGHPLPRLVIFGFGDFHGVRDRATESWMGLRGNARGFVPPHVDLGHDGRLLEMPGRVIPLSAFSRMSGLWNLIEHEYTRREAYAHDDDAWTREVHQAVLLELRNEVAASGSRLLVADLSTPPAVRSTWQRFFSTNKFDVAECVVDGLPGAHPDAFWHLLHADCIEREIRKANVLAN